MGNWKWFKDSEVVGLVPRIVDMLDVARSLAGFPIVITSPGRTVYENQAAGGVEDSEHLTGEGVDIKAPTGEDEYRKLAWALGRAGFRRIGFYDRHIHCGIRPEKPQDVVWFGVSHA